MAAVVASLSLCYSSRPNLLRRSFSRPKHLTMASMSEDPVREWILTEGKASQITKITSVGGGCINLATHYQTDAASFFVKTNRSIGPEMFEGEALGLEAMYETRSIRVGALPTGGSYIIMEFIEFGSRGSQVMPKEEGFEKRRDLYLLYHYLNHYNLFGSGYRSSAMSIIDGYLRMLSA
uniref:protein-ribulosamine 3-kinase n=1 Tax=Brassica campestris TaxID=3711 RepID=M4CGV3_BRACM